MPTALWYASPWRAWNHVNRASKMKTAKKLPSYFSLSLNKLSEASFGKISEKANEAATAAAPKDLRTGGNLVTGMAVGAGGGTAGVQSKMLSSVMPPFEFKNYKFAYKGGEIKLPGEQMDVLKRVKDGDFGVNAPSLLKNLNFGAMDLSGFNSAKLQSLTFVQKEDLGFFINILLDDGSINLSQNWEAWPAGKCGSDQSCYDAQRVKLEEIPTDTEAIAIADQFAKDHNVNMSAFGTGEVTNYWQAAYDSAPDKTSYYLPETVDVVYPLKINDQYVYDEYSGAKQGLVISVHVKTKKVASMYGLTTQNYDTSSYGVETDVKKLISYAEAGGVNAYTAEGAKTETLDLGEPTYGFIKYYNFKDNKSEELLVPALAFPINNPPKTDPNFNRKSVIIPLVKDIIDERQPMLFQRADTLTATATTATATEPVKMVK
ncbi:hypothetical protein HGA64_05100 [Candidatus Falkowbacteria bacterium]|nr:hypothetical protein [Candidatus Falkowbacteria bacterium]